MSYIIILNFNSFNIINLMLNNLISENNFPIDILSTNILIKEITENLKLDAISVFISYKGKFPELLYGPIILNEVNNDDPKSDLFNLDLYNLFSKIGITNNSIHYFTFSLENKLNLDIAFFSKEEININNDNLLFYAKIIATSCSREIDSKQNNLIWQISNCVQVVTPDFLKSSTRHSTG